MNHGNPSENRIARRVLSVACAAALVVAFTASVPKAAHAARVTPPAVPDSLKVPAGNTAYLKGHAVGTQNYVCLPADGGVAWNLFTPEATLFNGDDNQITTHFFSPNPEEGGTVRAAWQHSRDTSTVWAALFAPPFTDQPFVAPGAIAWLLLQEKGVRAGPDGGDALTGTSFVHRVNTQGGSAPETGCLQSTDIGNKAFVPYEADYFFYTQDDDSSALY